MLAEAEAEAEAEVEVEVEVEPSRAEQSLVEPGRAWPKPQAMTCTLMCSGLLAASTAAA